MKSVLALLVLAASALAQDATAIAAAQAACGPKDVNFEVKADANQHPTPQPAAGKALVYVIEDLGQCADCGGAGSGLNQLVTNVSEAVTKLGMDGAWVGANKGNSYLFLFVDPGEHHLCMNWQSRLAEHSRAFTMMNFTAEAGKTYYFRARLFPGNRDFSFDLDPINSDQGKFLVASYPFSVWHPKK